MLHINKSWRRGTKSSHILQGCTHLEELRQKTWSAITPIDRTFWETADELRKTVQFINASGQRI